MQHHSQATPRFYLTAADISPQLWDKISEWPETEAISSRLRLRLFHPVCILTVHQQDHASSSPTWNFFCACRIKIICTHFNIFPNVNGFPSFSGNDCSCTNLSPKCLGTRLLHNQQLHIKDCEGLVVVIECWQLKSGALRSLPTF